MSIISQKKNKTGKKRQITEEEMQMANTNMEIFIFINSKKKKKIN